MPIDIDEFESASSEELQNAEPPLRQGVLEFLSYNPGLAYSREELQSALDVDAIHILHELTLMERDGLVRHKGRYWAITPEDADADRGE